MEFHDELGNVVAAVPDDAEVLHLDRLPTGLTGSLFADGLHHLPKLKSLTFGLSDAQRPEEIEAIRGLTNLLELGISGIYRGQDISPIATCTNLKVLRLVGIYNVDITPIFSLKGLQALLISGKAKNLKPLATLRELNSLEILEAPRVPLKLLQELTKLRTLRLTNSKLSDMSPLLELPELTLLDLRATNIRSLDDLPRCPALSELVLDRCRQLRNLQGIERFPKLHSLRIRDIRAIDSLKPLQHLSALESLDMHNTNVADGRMAPLKHLLSLRDVGLPSTYQSQIADLARSLPKCRFTVSGSDSVLEVHGSVSILKDDSSEPIIYRIDQDLTQLLDVPTNEEAESILDRLLLQRFRDQHSAVEFDSEGERFVARSASLDALRALAQLINEGLQNP